MNQRIGLALLAVFSLANIAGAQIFINVNAYGSGYSTQFSQSGPQNNITSLGNIVDPSIRETA